MSWTVTLNSHRINFKNNTIRRFLTLWILYSLFPCSLLSVTCILLWKCGCRWGKCMRKVNSGNTPECVWQAGAPGRQTERATGSGLPLIIWQETQTLRFLKMDGNLINSFLPTGCSAQMELSEGEGSGKGLAVVAKGWTVWKLLCGL